jgi:hypothetical protein
MHNIYITQYVLDIYYKDSLLDLQRKDESWNANFNKGTVSGDYFELSARDTVHYMYFALAAYGWPMYLLHNKAVPLHQVNHK